jgi:Protein of unknown function (DUF2510)
MTQQEDEGVVADGLGDGDEFFSDDPIGADPSTGGIPRADATMASVPTGAGQDGADALWCSDPADPDLLRYWEGAAAGWFPDPLYPSSIRYWNGSCWTDLVTPRPPPVALLGPSTTGQPLIRCDEGRDEDGGHGRGRSVSRVSRLPIPSVLTRRTKRKTS